ncbi:MAG: SDR family NAD(P)-dependent oxidoreductase, partial [Planctomycetota bacterium JB042]
MDLGLADRVVWITGASGGIGRSLADAFAAEGARLLLTGGARVERAEEHARLRGWGDRALVRAADVTDEAALEAAAAAAR